MELTMHENEIAKEIVDAAFHIHKYFGPGMLESAYQTVLIHELNKRGLQLKSEVPIPIVYEGVQITTGFRADVIVEDKVIIELKSIEMILPVHKKQLFTYMKLANLKLGLLINFGSAMFKGSVTRIVNGLEEDISIQERNRRESF
jgi:GxxExxY protein